MVITNIIIIFTLSTNNNTNLKTSKIMKKVQSYSVAYPKDFLKGTAMRRGWGCGYLIIPKDHPFLVHTLDQQDANYFYLQVDGFDQEITLTEFQVDGSVKIGFDTAHSWNTEAQDENWVNQKTEENRRNESNSRSVYYRRRYCLPRRADSENY